jgi:ABC-2 type transport system ATP-binding protein
MGESASKDREVVIHVRRLNKIFRDPFGRHTVHAVRDLDLEVYRGEIFGFIGPNGSGKTTTMKILLGLLFPTSGEARVLGRPPRDIAVKHRIGFLPEESYLYEYLNADETLDFFGKLFGLPRAERRRRADHWIRRFGLEHARSRPIRGYSKGMRRRVAFAQALINDPEVLFLDEPTSGLDPISAREMKDLILELRDRGTTIFLSSHLLADVQSICDRIALIHEGVRRLYGSVREVATRAGHVTVVVRNLGDGARDALAEAVRTHGAEVVRMEETQESLEDVFVRVVRPPAPQ